MRAGLTLTLLLAIGLAEAAGQPPYSGLTDPTAGSAIDKAIEKGSYLSVVHEADGSRILVVNYPWTSHIRPSIEIATLPEGGEDLSHIRPLYFVATLMKERANKAIYYCEDHSDEVPVRMSFTEGDILFDVFGDRNSLSRPSAVITCQTKVPELKTRTDRALFCALKAWAVNSQTLFLSLPEESFAKPVRLRVWFLREGEVIWTGTAKWPGIPK